MVNERFSLLAAQKEKVLLISIEYLINSMIYRSYLFLSPFVVLYFVFHFCAHRIHLYVKKLTIEDYRHLFAVALSGAL